MYASRTLRTARRRLIALAAAIFVGLASLSLPALHGGAERASLDTPALADPGGGNGGGC